MRRYAENLQHGLVAPPQALSGTDDIKDITTKLDKMNQFANKLSMWYAKLVNTRLLSLRNPLAQSSWNKTRYTTDGYTISKIHVQQHWMDRKCFFKKGMEDFKKERVTHLNSLDKKIA